MDPGSVTAQPWYNNVAWNPGDFASISANHPDWFLLDTMGRRVTDPDLPGFYYMDPANVGWRQFWLSRAQYAQETYGWRGVFMDCVDLGINRFTRHGQQLANYPTDSAWQSAELGLLASVYPYFQSKGSPVWANLAEGPLSALPSYLNYLDGAMNEGFAVDWSTGYLSTTDWQNSLSWVDQLTSRNKKAILVAQGPGQQTNTVRQQFGFASYLLVDDAHASFRYADYNDYNADWLYSNYKAALGTPVTGRYLSGSVWRRDFTHGYVTVDPVSHASSIVTN
jgi:hypothetical protein